MTVKKRQKSRKWPKIVKNQNLRRDLITIIVWCMFRQELLISPMRNHRRRKSSMN